MRKTKTDELYEALEEMGPREKWDWPYPVTFVAYGVKGPIEVDGDHTSLEAYCRIVFPKGYGELTPGGRQLKDEVVNTLRRLNMLLEPDVPAHFKQHLSWIIDQVEGWAARAKVCLGADKCKKNEL